MIGSSREKERVRERRRELERERRGTNEAEPVSSGFKGERTRPVRLNQSGSPLNQLSHRQI
jgi:hypothetical protein